MRSIDQEQKDATHSLQPLRPEVIIGQIFMDIHERIYSADLYQTHYVHMEKQTSWTWINYREFIDCDLVRKKEAKKM